MKVQNVSAPVVPFIVNKSSNAGKNSNFTLQNQFNNAKSVSSAQILSQMPNVSFKGTLSENDRIEIIKSQFTKIAESQSQEGKTLDSLKTKIEIAKLCKKQGNEYDAFILEDAIRTDYSKISKTEKEQAIREIYHYNPEMSKNIEKDIQEMKDRQNNQYMDLWLNADSDIQFSSLGDMAGYYPEFRCDK